MDAAKWKNIIGGTLATLGLVIWLLFWRLTATGTSGNSSRFFDKEYMLMLVAGVYGAIVAAVVVFLTRKKQERALHVLVVAPAIAVVSGVLLLMLDVAIFYPADPSTHGNEVTRRLFPVLAIGVIYSWGLSLFMGFPALLAAVATSCFLRASDTGTTSPPALPGARQEM